MMKREAEELNSESNNSAGDDDGALDEVTKAAVKKVLRKR
jgi:hypothetical protein